jgi:DNA-binding NtrC family response regulator
VQAIVTRYGGRVTLASGQDGGARFEVQLRAIEEREGQGQADEAAARAPGEAPPLRVACIDDESLVLRYLARVLERAGHQVRAFEEPREALEYLRQHAGELDWVVSDESMPNLKGSELALELWRLAPELPFVLLSGDTGKVPDELPPNVKHLLQKPVDVRRLRQLVVRRSSSD